VDGEELAQSLANQGQLPDLRGMTVLFLGLGETVAPQAKLSPAQREHLSGIWKAIAAKANATCVDSVVQLRETIPTGSLPPVPTVALPTSVNQLGTSAFEVQFGDALTFAPDSATFRDRDQAVKALQPIADQAAAQPTKQIRVVGTSSASGAMAAQLELSKRRAQAVADVLVSLGVTPARIDVEGVGSNFSGYVSDIGSQGELIPGAAAKNRKVLITIG
jgi:outer membrane protein OmpA-like peptidoglycan-associated protein